MPPAGSGRVIAGVAFLLIVSWAAGARIVLKNGSEIEGLVVEDVPGDYVSVRTPSAVLKFTYDQIQSIDRETSHAVEEQIGDQLSRQGNLKEAIENYLSAKESGHGSPDIDKKIQRVRRQIEEEELAQYTDQIQQAQELISQGKLDQAQGMLKELHDNVALESVRNRALVLQSQVHYQKAQRAMDVVDYTTAEHELNLAIEQNPALAAAHVELGDLYNTRQLGKTQALREYLKAIELGADQLQEKENNRVRWSIARISQETEDYPQALKFYRMVYASDPRFDPRLVDSLMTVYRRMADKQVAAAPDKSIELLREALGYQTADASIRYRLAEILFGQERYDEALAELQYLFGHDPRYPNAHFLAAQCLTKLRKVLDARAELTEELRTNPKHTAALVELGEISLQGGAISAAESYFSKALEADPSQISALLGMAKVKRRQDDLRAARRYVETVVELRPDNREANLIMGSILKEEKNYSEARKFFNTVVDSLQKQKQALSDDEKQLLADALNLRGEIFLLQEQPRTARNDFEEALKQNPSYGLTYYNMGLSYEKDTSDETNLGKAEANLIKARELKPDSPEFAQALGILYQQYLSQQNIDDTKKKEYLKKAVTNYRDYLKLGGGEVDKVKKWIEECGGKVNGE